MEYFSDIKKKNEIMPFAATCMDLEMTILRKTKKDKYYITYVEPKQNDTKKKQITNFRNKLWLEKGKCGGNKLHILD